jgi:hypothetical protein
MKTTAKDLRRVCAESEKRQVFLMLVDTDVLIWYLKGHNNAMQLGDALISATAVANGLDIFTGNVKHYQILTGISLKEFRSV